VNSGPQKAERSPDKTVVNEVYRVIVGNPGHPDHFPYIDCWQDAVLSWPTWLRLCLEEAYRITVGRVATTSKCREETKQGEGPEEKQTGLCSDKVAGGRDGIAER
jgi:hypothetical protein